MSTRSIVRFLAGHAVWNIGPREALPGTRYGEMAGTGAGAATRGDGLDFAYAFNRRVTTGDHDFIKGQIDAYLDRYGSRL